MISPVTSTSVATNGADALARRYVLAKRRLIHAGRVGEFCVVVIAENIIERLGRGGVRVDVRMRVEQGNAANLGVQVARQAVGQHEWSQAQG